MKKNNNRYRQCRFYLLISAIISLSYIEKSFSDDYFDPTALSYGTNQNIADLQTLAQFSKPGGQLPGDYIVDIYINNEKVGSELISFLLNENDNNIYPVFVKEQLVAWGLKY